MISHSQFIQKLAHEVRIIKHLWTKATTPELLSFRFSETQRTTAQWMAYLAIVWGAATRDIIHDDMSGFSTFKERYAQFDITTFESTIDTDLADIIDILKWVDEEKLAEQKTLFGRFTDSRGGHMLTAVYNRYVAYKTQLFLQLKAGWLSELTTSNLRAGEDMPPTTDEKMQ